MINIYNIDGSLLMQVLVTKEAKREEEMSKSDYIFLSFNSNIKVTLPVGSYIVHTYYIDSVRKVTRRFLLLDPYEPEQADEMSWKYAPEFQHPKMILGKVPFYINTKNSQNETIKQTNWSFLGTPDAIMTYICDFLNKDLQFGSCGWKSVLTGKLKNSLNVSFSNNDVLSLLSAVANAAGDKCEWHIDYDNEIIYLGNVVIGDSGYKLEVGENVGVSSVSASKEEFYNSFIVFGGSRNITQTNNKGENISSGDIRLQLPVRNGNIHLNNKDVAYTIDKFSVIDIRQNKQSEPLLTKVLNFSEIYPSLNTYVYRVRGREKYVIDSETNKKVPLIYNSDGSVASYKTFTVWYMQLAYCTTIEEKDKKLVNTTVDEGVKHYWYAFELSDNLLVNGKKPSCSFEPNFEKGALPSPLCGRGTNGEHVGFQLHYHKNKETVHDSDDVSSSNFVIYAGDYEIIYQEESNLIIPTNLNEGLVPNGENLPSLRCNIVVLYNIAMSNKYQEEAQEKLLDQTIDEIKRLSSDLNNYTCKSYPQVFEEKNPRLQIGQRVIYNDGQGYELETRVLKLSTNIDYDIIQEITVGNQTLKGTITQLKEDVQSIISNGNSSGSQGGYTVSQINRLIAQYGIRYFLSKTDEDTAQKAITFMEGLKLGKDGKRGLTGDGNAVLGDVVVDRVHDPHSTEADRTIIGAQGFDLYMGADGKSHMYIDYLTTRVKMFAAGAEIRKVSYSGGTTIFSNAGSTIVKVAYVMDANGEKVIAYKCYAAADDGTTRTMNWWRPGMMAMCQTFNVKAQTEGELANRYYWRLVVAVGQETLEDGRLYDYVVLSNVERFNGTDEVVPSYGLKLLADGTGKVLTFGGAAVAVAAASGLTSLGAVLEQDGVTMDDYDFSVSGRNYAGYEPAEGGGEPDVPMAGDVIVQVGDQVKWLSRGNAIKLSTSTEDDVSGTAPAIAMYHGIGNYADEKGKEDLSTIWKWRNLTFLASPPMTYVNSDNFKVFTKGNIKTAYDVSDRFMSIEGNIGSITSTVAETEKKVGEVDTNLTTFKQTSKEFSLKVVQRSEGRFNLLTGTAFKRKEASWTGNDTYEPWITTVYQYDGINAVVIDGAKGKNRGVDFLRVKVGRNRTHTVSAMLACDGDVAYRDFGVYIVQKDAQMNDIGNNLSIYCEVAKNMSTGWNLMTETFELDARTAYADCVFIYSGAHTARIALPMLTEGSEFLGWSLSEEDCNYRGGNLLARADTLTNGDGLTVDSKFTKLLEEGDADRYGSYATLCTDIRSGAVGRIDTVTWDLSGKGVIKQGQDYMLSFMAKGDSDADAYAHIAAFLHNDGTPDVAVEICGHVINTSTPDGEALMSVSGKWQKYYVHWRVIGDSLPQAVVLRTFTGSRLFVSQIKLEVGATATEWTAESSDYVEDRSMLASLLDTGIDINSKEITMTAERTKFRTRTGKEVAVFDEDGLNADLINVKHLWAESENGKNKVGYFGNYDTPECMVGSEYAPLFVGTSTAKDAPFYVTSTGAIKAVKGYIGCFEINVNYLKHGTPGETDYMSLNSSDIVFRSRDDNFGLVLGNAILGGVEGLGKQGGMSLNSKRDWNDPYDYKQVNFGMMLSVSGKMNLEHRELQDIAGSSWPNGNHALFISKGDIAGMRPMLTVATANRALSKMECVVVCRAGVTLTLPSDPEIGQYYKIIKAMANTVTMKSEGASITYWFIRKESGDIQSRTSKTAATCALDAYVQDAELFFDGTVWQCRQYGYVLG
jgi:hypothetical protein